MSIEPNRNRIVLIGLTKIDQAHYPSLSNHDFIQSIDDLLTPSRCLARGICVTWGIYGSSVFSLDTDDGVGLGCF